MEVQNKVNSILSGSFSVTVGKSHAMCSHVGVRYKNMNQDFMLGVSFPVSEKEKVWCFGVFDGHGKGGEFASQEAANSISNYLRKEIINNFKSSGNPVSDSEWTVIMKKLVHNGFLAAHQSIINLYSTFNTYEDYSGQFWQKEEGAEGQTEWASSRRNDLNDFGTTAVVTVLRILNGTAVQMVVANSGDSLAYLFSKNGVNKVLTTFIHGPKNETEIDRVSDKMKLDGIYFGVKQKFSPNYYFYGLAMTRALGHMFSSKYGIIPDPTTYDYDIGIANRYLVLASDGVSDVISEEELGSYITECINKGHSLGECSQLIVQHCLDLWLIKFPKPSAPYEITDNTSVIIIDLTTI